MGGYFIKKIKNMISVDSVYQKVLALANKEQRGYITPQEFNLFADHAQMDIFRQYFYDLDQLKRQTGSGYESKYHLEEKISFFSSFDNDLYSYNTEGDILISGLENFYKLTSVRVNYNNSGEKQASYIPQKEYSLYSSSPLIQNSSKIAPYYIYTRHTGSYGGKIRVYPYTDPNTDVVKIDYIRKPRKPNWTYVIVNENAMFNPSADVGWYDFELHDSEENLLVIKILQLAGINIKDGSLVQLAAQEEMKKTQQEKA